MHLISCVQPYQPELIQTLFDDDSTELKEIATVGGYHASRGLNSEINILICASHQLKGICFQVAGSRSTEKSSTEPPPLPPL